MLQNAERNRAISSQICAQQTIYCNQCSPKVTKSYLVCVEDLFIANLVPCFADLRHRSAGQSVSMRVDHIVARGICRVAAHHFAEASSRSQHVWLRGPRGRAYQSRLQLLCNLGASPSMPLSQAVQVCVFSIAISTVISIAGVHFSLRTSFKTSFLTASRVHAERTLKECSLARPQCYSMLECLLTTVPTLTCGCLLMTRLPAVPCLDLQLSVCFGFTCSGDRGPGNTYLGPAPRLSRRPGWLTVSTHRASSRHGGT